MQYRRRPITNGKHVSTDGNRISCRSATGFIITVTENMMNETNDKIVETVGLLNHVWSIIVSNAEFKKAVHLKYVNHMWDHDRPYWYLWYNDCAGVYKMQLQRSEISKGYDWVAQFTVKYFPTPTEPAFSGLSTLEKLCRTSEMFHSPPTYGECDCPCHGTSHTVHEHKHQNYAQNTGAPHADFNEIIPVDFFSAGNVLIAFNSRSGSIVRLNSQTSWKTVMQKDFTLHDDSGDILAILKKGETDRDYPGLAISRFLYEKVVKSWSLVHRYTFQNETTLEANGLIFTSDGYSVISESSPEVRKIVIQSELHRTTHEKLEPYPFEDSSMIMQSIN
jgi:hypothetical protein